MLASYGIARIVQAFPKIELAPGETWEEPGEERHILPLPFQMQTAAKSCSTDGLTLPHSMWPLS